MARRGADFVLVVDQRLWPEVERIRHGLTHVAPENVLVGVLIEVTRKSAGRFTISVTIGVLRLLFSLVSVTNGNAASVTTVT